MARNLLEDFIAHVNGNSFLREFSFSNAMLNVAGKGEVEVSDHLVAIGPYVLAYQLKERSVEDDDAKSAEKWFKSKVEKLAVGQIASTKELLRGLAGQHLRNDRGHVVPLPHDVADRMTGVVVYRIAPVPGYVPPLSKVSKRAGFVHFLSDVDYFNVCKFLTTPVEIADYLQFRRQVLEQFHPISNDIDEQALVGQFLMDSGARKPSASYRQVLSALQDSRADWDISFITQNLGRQIIYRDGSETGDTSHYHILEQLGLLSRTELKEFVIRLRLALEAVNEDRFERPYRFGVPRLDCGFLIFPVPKEMHAMARQGLMNFGLASKHEMDVTKQVALSVAKHGEHTDIEWLFVEGANEPNPELDQKLKEDNPFRPTSERLTPRYLFNSDALPEEE